MARPAKSRKIEGVPVPALYSPSGWNGPKEEMAELAIEDFEVMRLVDAYAYHIEEAAKKVGVSRSTAGRMLERARRSVALALDRRIPFCIDALDSSVLEAPSKAVCTKARKNGKAVAFALAKQTVDSELSRLFGRAAAFAVVNEKGGILLLENPATGAKRHVARQVVDTLAQQGVERVVAGRFGPIALQALGEAKIEPVVMSGVSLSAVLDGMSLFE